MDPRDPHRRHDPRDEPRDEPRDDRLHREVRALKVYAVASSALLVILTLGAFRQQVPQGQKGRFTELDVERINIVEPDGKLRMVLSNRPRSIGPIYKGKPFGYEGGGRPGIIFFNDEGTENGGLTFTGSRGADGKYRASSGFSFAYLRRMAIRPGISCSATEISLRPQSARDMSATL